MNRIELDRIHAAAASWHLYFCYFAPTDPRTIVRKRHGIGWTLNFARVWAVPTLLAMLGAVWETWRIAASCELSQTAQWGIVIAVIIGVGLFCGWMANPDRVCSPHALDADQKPRDEPSI